MHLDGRLAEDAWRLADSITDFRQREPNSGAPTTERTVVKVLRDNEALFVGVRAYDDEVRRLRATQLRRDADLEVDDNITLLIDGLFDRRSGFVFRTNANGAMWDAQFTGVDDVNPNWNGLWDVAVWRDSLGWSAEFRIPFRTIRFKQNGGAFGFNVQRFIGRKNETALWRGWGRAEGLYRLIYEGTLLGFGDLRRGGAFEVRPYALATATADDHDAQGNSLSHGDASAKAGLDVKLAVAPTLTADFTVNTDFAQVEVDQQVINLTRFPTFFPEKRDFFLESSGIFDFGTPGRVQPFYSRRIGLSDSGSTVPIVAGARMYGRIGAWTVGALDAQTGASDRANDLVVRVKHDLFARGYVGAIGVQHATAGAPGAEQVGGLDIDLPLVVSGRNLEPSFWIMGSRAPGTPGVPVAWRYGTDFPNDLFDNFVSLYRINAGFAPTLGFVNRTGIWETTGHIDFMPRPHLLGIRQLDIQFPIPSWDIIASERGSLASSANWQTASFEWRPLGGTFHSGASFELNVQRFLDAPSEPFDIFPGAVVAPGRYWWTRGDVQYSSSPSRPLSVSAQLGWGGFYDGHSTEESLGIDWRGGGHFIAGTTWSRSRVELPAAAFTATQLTGRVEYAVNTRTALLGFVQYNSEDQRVDFNLRFHWIPRIGDDVFVVWNSGYTTESGAAFRFPHARSFSHPLNGAFIVKAIHQFTP